MSRSESSVWVIAEQVRGQIPNVCLELIGQARKLADELRTDVEAVLLGHGTRDQIDTLFQSGADVVYLGDSPEFKRYQAEIFMACILALAKEVQPQIILIGSTFIGRELAPLIAANLETGLTAHCIELLINICPEKRPQIATVARGVFPMPELDEERSGRLVPVEPPKDLNLRMKTLDEVHNEPEGVPLESAPIVVAGGAGAETVEGWQEIEALAGVLNAALGSTRPVVDYGWAELETMIGQSGKMVSPDLYIGIGLSGEQQHMVGITDAKVMVAINNDPKSPVFEQVDYGIVEDCRGFIPLLVRKLQG